MKFIYAVYNPRTQQLKTVIEVFGKRRLIRYRWVSKLHQPVPPPSWLSVVESEASAREHAEKTLANFG